MINTVITVYTKTGEVYSFEDLINPGSGTSALTQFTSGQDIHANGTHDYYGTIQNHEYYIPYVAIDHIIVERLDVPGGPEDDVCQVEETTQVDPGEVVDPGQGNQ